MSRLPEDFAIGMAVPKDNSTYSAIIKMLEESVKSETNLAIGNPIATAEQRAWQCGRADALTAFRELIANVREDALKQRDLPLD
jgi:hypothetical protein